MGRGVPGQRHGMRRRTARGWRTTRWTIDRSGSRTGARCWTEPARTRERAPVSAATEPDAAFRNDAGGYFLPADASSPAFGRKRSRAVSKIIPLCPKLPRQIIKSMASIFVTSSLPSTIGASFAIFTVYFNRAAFWHRTGCIGTTRNDSWSRSEMSPRSSTR